MCLGPAGDGRQDVDRLPVRHPLHLPHVRRSDPHHWTHVAQEEDTPLQSEKRTGRRRTC